MVKNVTQAKSIRNDVLALLNVPDYLESISYDDRYRGIYGIRYQDLKERLQNIVDQDNPSERKYTDGAIVGALNTISDRNPSIKRMKTEKGTYFVDFSNKIGKWDKLQDDLFSDEVKEKSKEINKEIQKIILDISEVLQNIENKKLNTNQKFEIYSEIDKLLSVRNKLMDASKVWTDYSFDNRF